MFDDVFFIILYIFMLCYIFSRISSFASDSRERSRIVTRELDRRRKIDSLYGRDK